MHLQLVDEAQAIEGEKNFDRNKSSSKADCEWSNAKNMDIWQDEQTKIVLNGGQISTKCTTREIARIKKIIMQYNSNHEKLMFNDLVVFKLKGSKHSKFVV